MAKKAGLGNVFDSIFDDDFLGEDGGADNTSTLKIGDIEPNRNQPRKHFDDAALAELADSIATHGVITPLIVRPYEGIYQIVAGERRWRASRMAGLTEVPVRIVNIDDEKTAQYALIENLQREDLNPLEEANGYYELIERYNIRQEDVAKWVGKARSSVTNSLRLLTLPDDIKGFVESGELSKGHCKALLGLTDAAQMSTLAQKTISSDLSVRALEKMVQKITAPASKKKDDKKSKKTTIYTEAQIALTEKLGKPVRVKEGKNRITLEIDVYNEEEFMDIVKKLS